MLVESRVHVSVVLFPSVMSNWLVLGVMEGRLNTIGKNDVKDDNYKDTTSLCIYLLR